MTSPIMNHTGCIPPSRFNTRVKFATRTRTDRHGRRHSVAVPLVPPPDGEKFEGGYYVERNPITGGAKLVAPCGGKVGTGEEMRPNSWSPIHAI